VRDFSHAGFIPVAEVGQLEMHQCVQLPMTNHLHRLLWSYSPYGYGGAIEWPDFPGEFADELRHEWKELHGRDIEESLNISGYSVSRIASCAHEVLKRWSLEEEAPS